MIECVDIFLDGFGITVWSCELPPDDDHDNWLDLVYPGTIPSREAALEYAKSVLGDFNERGVI